MLKMSWDEELARSALAHSRRCIAEHSTNRKTSKFPQVGENMSRMTGSEIDTGSFVTKAIELWDKEKKEFVHRSGWCNNPPCGHYTQLAWNTTYAVGCGVTTCYWPRLGNRIGMFLVCQYGPAGNYRPPVPYEAGPTCKKCPNWSVCRNGLCEWSSGGNRESNTEPQGGQAKKFPTCTGHSCGSAAKIALNRILFVAVALSLLHCV